MKRSAGAAAAGSGRQAGPFPARRGPSLTRTRRGAAVAAILLCVVVATWRHAAQAAPTAAQLQHSLSPAAAELEALWARYLSGLREARIEGQASLAEALAPFCSGSYVFSLAPHQLKRGFVKQVKGARLRRLVRTQLLAPSPRPLKIGVIGTSVSWGTGACGLKGGSASSAGISRF